MAGNLSIHPAPGFGDLLPGWYAVPQNPVDAGMSGISYTPGIGDILPGVYAVPQNPLKDYISGQVRLIGQQSNATGQLNGAPVGGGCGCGCGGHGGCGSGMGAAPTPTGMPSVSVTPTSETLTRACPGSYYYANGRCVPIGTGAAAAYNTIMSSSYPGAPTPTGMPSLTVSPTGETLTRACPGNYFYANGKCVPFGTGASAAYGAIRNGGVSGLGDYPQLTADITAGNYTAALSDTILGVPVSMWLIGAAVAFFAFSGSTGPSRYSRARRAYRAYAS